MDKCILIVLAVLFYFFILRDKSHFIADIATQKYNNNSFPESCNYGEQMKVYPSGKVPASYLSLSDQERETLLKRFVDDKVVEFNDEFMVV